MKHTLRSVNITTHCLFHTRWLHSNDSSRDGTFLHHSLQNPPCLSSPNRPNLAEMKGRSLAKHKRKTFRTIPHHLLCPHPLLEAKLLPWMSCCLINAHWLLLLLPPPPPRVVSSACCCLAPSAGLRRRVPALRWRPLPRHVRGVRLLRTRLRVRPAHRRMRGKTSDAAARSPLVANSGTVAAFRGEWW